MLKTLKQGNFQYRTVLVRVDYNVPMHGNEVVDPTRIDRTVPTIRYLLDAGAKVVLMSHMGRPKGRYDERFTLKPLLPLLEERFQCKVHFAGDCLPPIAKHVIDRSQAGEITLLENLRFHPDETENGDAFSELLAELGDVYVNDAFGCSHRAHASVVGIANHMKERYAGLLMESEIQALSVALDHPKRPLCAIVAGSKVSSKIDLLTALLPKVDVLIIGGGMANTFLKAQGKSMGQSYLEDDWCAKAHEILEQAQHYECKIILPVDGVVARDLQHAKDHMEVSVDEIPEDMMMLDIGPETIKQMISTLEKVKTVIWNGPLGAFEISPFHKGSQAVAEAIARLTQQGKVMSVAGGGDVVAAIKKAEATEGFSYISTAGGAFLEWMEGKTLPALTVLDDHGK